ncbi:hypothetical protein Hanom_Chr15g01337231 [Helianthus anomalus]
MKLLRFFLSSWNMVVMWGVMFDPRELVMRESLYGDENHYTQYVKSLVTYTLTVTKIHSFSFLGGIGLGWACVQVVAGCGWVGVWAGSTFLVCWLWDGPLLGWFEDIRGGWVDQPCSFSRSHLVVCFFLFVWSVGVFAVPLPLFTLRFLVGGHKRCWLLAFMSDIYFYQGDIRQDWLGGLSFRCSPPCTHTPMPETVIGFRNPVESANFVYRWDWDVGWALGWDIIWGFACVCDCGVRYSLGLLQGCCVFAKPCRLFWGSCKDQLRKACCRVALGWGVHQNGVIWRLNLWLFGYVYVRSKHVIKGWVRRLMKHYKLDHMTQVWFKDWLVKKTTCACHLLYQFLSIEKTWLWYRFRIVRVGKNVFWILSKVVHMLWQTFFYCWNLKKLAMQESVTFWTRGISVLSGYGRNHQMELLVFYERLTMGYLGWVSCKGTGLLCGLLGLVFGHQGWVDWATDLYRGCLWLLTWSGSLWQLKCLSSRLWLNQNIGSVGLRGNLVETAARFTGLTSAAAVRVCMSWMHHARSMGCNLQRWKGPDQSMPSKECRGKKVLGLVSVHKWLEWFLQSKSWKEVLLSLGSRFLSLWSGYMQRRVSVKVRIWPFNRDTAVVCWEPGPIIWVCQLLTLALILMCPLKRLELIALFRLYWALHGPFSESATTTIIWAYGMISDTIGHLWLMCDTNICGLPIIYRLPSVFPRYSVRFLIHCKARVLCIPRVGLLVSYFWSPEHVPGDDEGGMPPLKV